MEGTNIDALKRALFLDAKEWWFYSNMCGAGVLVLGMIMLATNQGSIFYALGAGVLVVFSALFRWRSDTKKGAAETVLRRFEMKDGLGWAINEREMQEILANAPDSAKAALGSEELSKYFASSSKIGLLRMIENLEESARWSKRLSKKVSDWVFLGTGIVIGLAFVALIVALWSSIGLSMGDRIGKVVITMLVFLFSDGYLRLAFDYKAFADKALEVELLAGEMKKRATIEEADAITLQNDYQVARAQSPLIPEAVYQRASKKLNDVDTWQDAKSQDDSDLGKPT